MHVMHIFTIHIETIFIWLYIGTCRRLFDLTKLKPLNMGAKTLGKNGRLEIFP